MSLASASKIVHGFLYRSIEIDFDSSDRVDIHLVFMCAIEIDLGLSVGIEFALFFVRGPKSTSVLCAGRKVLGLNLWIEIDFVFSVGIEIVLFFVCGPKMTCF